MSEPTRTQLSVAQTEAHLNEWMNAEGGPGLLTILEALARVCLAVASNRRDHVLFSAEAEHVWTPVAKKLVGVKVFAEKQRASWCNTRER